MKHHQTSLEKAWLARASEMETFEPDQARNVRMEDVEEEKSDDGFRGLSRRILSPIHEVPTRNRFDTAETDQICNYVRSDTPLNIAQFFNKHNQHDMPGDDTQILTKQNRDDTPVPRTLPTRSVRRQCAV